MFIGDLIEGETYETFTGDLIKITTVDKHYIGYWLYKKRKSAAFFIHSPVKVRKIIKDFA